MKKVTIELEPNKTVKIYAPDIKEWGTITVMVEFVELNIQRRYRFDPEQIKTWLEANPDKTWKDFARARLLPIYNRLKLAKEMIGGMT